MLSLDSPVQVVPKVGPKYKELLEKLNILTVGDLLYHFPFRYDDLSNIKKIADIKSGEHITIAGVLGPVQNIFTRNGKKITKGSIVDSTGTINLLWFNQHYIKNAVFSGKRYYCSGEVSIFDRKLTIVSPELELFSENNIHTGRLVPIYPETYGVSSKWLRSRINDITHDFENRVSYAELIPQEIMTKENLMELTSAIKMIHFPKDMETEKHARYRFQFEELFLELLRVEKRRADWKKLQKGQVIKTNNKLMEKFYTSLPFELTKSQIKAINDILSDLENPQPMNRLLEGDVGSGKTIVAVAAALATCKDNLKAIYLAPTEILARQHFASFKNYLEPFDINVGLVTGSEKNASENSNVIVGTHALLFNGNFSNTGLVIIDEQHRFGVEQRGKLVELAKDNLIPNLLTLTATPIPRTLALTIYGDLEISPLESPQDKMRKVETKVLPEEKRDEAYKWAAGKRVPTFIVCPLIEDSESESLENVKSAETEFINVKKYFPENKVGLLHGRMKPKEKQEIIDKFTKGEILALVATPVIEVGIDIPDASVIIVESAERYSLASLHQLRGRVGRNGQQSYCVLFMSNFSKTGYERLKNLETINNGLRLAEIDMYMRGQGDIFSTLQHGYRKFRVASLENVELIEKAKKAASETYENIESFPILTQKLKDYENDLIRNN